MPSLLSRFAPFLTCLCGTLAFLGMAAAAALAQEITFGPGPGGSIPDNDTTGISSTINVVNPNVITGITGITINGLTHTYAGDLEARLTHGGTTITLFNQPPGGSGGDSTNLGGNYTFAPGGANFETALGALSDTQTLASGTYAPSPDAGALGAFNGMAAAGDWTLNLRDLAGFDVGSFTSWSITAMTAPPPRGSGGVIPDGDPKGITSDIVVSDTGAITDFSSVSIFGLRHTQIGDLVATLAHVETGTTVDLFNRPGRTTNDPFDYGSPANFNGAYAFTNSGTSLVLQAQQGNTSYDIPAGTYAISTSQVSGQENVTTLAGFHGETAFGTWRLVIRDMVSGDIGTFDGWDFSAAASGMVVPEPGSLVLAGAGILAAVSLVAVARSRRRFRLAASTEAAVTLSKEEHA